ncbi:hypothetical protein IA539_09855 [Gordonia sp. zg691]|uniref:Uncharacterized protein n=1 Tax=Gordonia jinghuaiqii TaxID=2758710 RepID=A0A7D7LUY1_9ACTN|nr:hypothetical protein [Gordonia jinghuaiqii]MBD0861515.1 hypothetical protein [Gordonia jinghuaiqii]MCR5976429.1 hypothetical protein [Gordonia jinghuaiqii]QMT03640.1 hypothetical protein H1R19_11475 [Gordonia jinghuaiqii]
MLTPMTDTTADDTTAENTADEAGNTPRVEAPGEVVASVRRFVAREGGSAKVVLQAIGAAGVRITVVGDANGILGDRVVPDLATAQAVVDAVDGLELAEWDRDLTSEATVSPSHYRKMAGWVARQKRFPKARNRAIL